MLTLKTYAHAIREEKADLSFADFEGRDGSERLYRAPARDLQRRRKPSIGRVRGNRSGPRPTSRYEMISPLGIRAR